MQKSCIFLQKETSYCKNSSALDPRVPKHWELSNGNYKGKWFKGDIASKSVELITADKSNGVDDDDKIFKLFSSPLWILLSFSTFSINQFNIMQE